MYVSNLALPSTRLVIILLKRLRWRMTISNKELQRETFYGLNLSTSFQIHPHVHLPVRGHQAKNPGAILSQRNNWRLRETGPSIRLAAGGGQTASYFPLQQNCPRILGLLWHESGRRRDERHNKLGNWLLGYVCLSPKLTMALKSFPGCLWC